VPQDYIKAAEWFRKAAEQGHTEAKDYLAKAEAAEKQLQERIPELKKIREHYAKYNDCISVTSFHTVGLKADGSVVAIGDNGCGQCNTGIWRDIVAITADSSQTVGLKSDGTVVAVGSNVNGQCNTSSWRDIGPASGDQVLKWKQSLQWQKQGLCKYCGGQVSGLITKKCKSCGKKN